jgi:two-component system, NtrC family, nitrogen regulation response regulator NtrX
MADTMRLCVVDDEEAIRTNLKEILEEEGYTVMLAGSIDGARECMALGVDCALVDIKLGGENGIDLLRELKAAHPAMPVIMISGHGTVALAAEAFKLGAHEFMEKPLRLIQVKACIRNALESVRLKHRVSQQARQMFPAPVYRSAIMTTLYQQVGKLSGQSEPVVILGPSGSGKELVARALHFEGPRADGPFIATNAASMPVTLAEDELFGHEKGAFTGATGRRAGCIEQADGGTLFLDEIGDMDPLIQAKLLRVLETGQFTRLGATAPVTVRVRIIAATHKDLEARAREGVFRHDLWYRLCAFVLRVPPLEERREDIPLLATALLSALCAETGEAKTFSQAALEKLTRGSYPGNIRELKHIVTRAAVFSHGSTIEANAISFGAGLALGGAATLPASDYSQLDLRTARDRFEKDYFSAVLAKNKGNITATAASIGMAQSNLSRKLKELGLR